MLSTNSHDPVRHPRRRVAGQVHRPRWGLRFRLAVHRLDLADHPRDPARFPRRRSRTHLMKSAQTTAPVDPIKPTSTESSGLRIGPLPGRSRFTPSVRCSSYSQLCLSVSSLCYSSVTCPEKRSARGSRAHRHASHVRAARRPLDGHPGSPGHLVPHRLERGSRRLRSHPVPSFSKLESDRHPYVHPDGSGALPDRSDLASL